MYLSEDIARQIINLNPNPDLDIIDVDVAERQFQVILKGFNHLIDPKNNFLYIADEVGLGKTYVAIGIASLLRYFSEHPGSYNDVIIVPKQNLQYKWQKEINNFIQRNYLIKDNIVKSILNKPTADLSKENIKHQLSVFQNNSPNYIIYRNSSFSISSDTDIDSERWMVKLRNNLPEYHKTLFEQIFKKFKKNQIIVKRAYAYLLNQSLPVIDLLIVDEAHNFKHGVEENVSIRNQVVSRFFGACQEDEELFDEFPELKENLKPKVKKLLFLSATPLNSQLYEIKRQLDCFLEDHLFVGKEDEKQTEDFINQNLNKFLIRGLMTINVNQKPYSRNSYRHEHRFGNVIMKEDAEPQYIKDNKTALVLCLMQYKTIKELKQKNNNQFEMGMLAGFESFTNTISKYEEETLENRRMNEAKDDQVISSIVESYYKAFSDYPPHPKQDSLVDELFNNMLDRRKSLVFVRRIASVRELERKLYKKYSDHLIGIIKNQKNYKRYAALKKLIEKSELEKDREDIERIIDLMADRVLPELKNEAYIFMNVDMTPVQIIKTELWELFNTAMENRDIEIFQQGIQNHLHRKRIDSKLRILSISLLHKIWNKSLVLDDEVEEEETPIDEEEFKEEKSVYFFQRYFYDEGKNFKKKVYRKDWLELNLLLINDRFSLFLLDKQKLSVEPEFGNAKVDFQKFSILREQTIQALRSTDKNDSIIHDEYRSNTFLTEMLLEMTQESFSKWIAKHDELIKHGIYNRFIEELETLNEILRSIFRQGSGLIPVFIADALTAKLPNSKEAFILEMKRLLLGEFNFVLREIETIIDDYDKIVEKNFNDKFKIRYNLIQQLPVLGVSGFHKRDVRKSAIQFRMPGYPYVLIATDILKEGEDLHSYCKNIYHYGIAWNPSDMEQRTGRVDRIDSLAYRKIKEISDSNISEIPFDNKLQVFYPYLADTLEVNQMCKLFRGMNRFIDIFYNDLSVKIEKDSKAQVDELVENITPQRTGLLESKYDVQNFIGFENGISFVLKPAYGTSFIELQRKMELVYNLLQVKEHFQNPEIDIDNLQLTGVLKIRNNRQGPYKCAVSQKKQLGVFEFQLSSCLGRINLFGSAAVRLKLEYLIKKINNIEKHNSNLRLHEENSYVWLQLSTDIETNTNLTFNKLVKLIILTDRIEASISKKDETLDLFN